MPPYTQTHTAYEPSPSKYTPPQAHEYCTPCDDPPSSALRRDSLIKINAATLPPVSDTSSEGLAIPDPNKPLASSSLASPASSAEHDYNGPASVTLSCLTVQSSASTRSPLASPPEPTPAASCDTTAHPSETPPPSPAPSYPHCPAPDAEPSSTPSSSQSQRSPSIASPSPSIPLVSATAPMNSDPRETHAENTQTHKHIASRDSLKNAPPLIRHSRYRHTSDNEAPPLIGSEAPDDPIPPHKGDQIPAQRWTNPSGWPIRREDVHDSIPGLNEPERDLLDYPFQLNFLDA